jgi:hypothetical protein
MNTEYMKRVIFHLFNPLRDEHKQLIRYDLLFLKEVFHNHLQQCFFLCFIFTVPTIVIFTIRIISSG